jgi:hypothetical protein
MTRHQTRQPDERGTSLILALVFVFAVGMVLVAVGGLAANALLNSNNARAQRTSAQDAETAVTIAMQYVRYIPALPSPSACLPPNSTIPSSDPRSGAGNPLEVYCTTTVTPTSIRTRVVEFFACSSGTSADSCVTASPLLHAEVSYNDLNSQGVDDCYDAQPEPVTTSCGTSMTVNLWDVIGADS